MEDKLQFKISSALKNLIWKELITDKYVAIFELVKNSFDAYAEKVHVDFFKDKILIRDDWKWMNIDDIKNKWLVVAYSAKADNSENRGYNDFRNKIKTRKAFAGAKWIWRFASDSLGKTLKLTSIKEEKNPKIEQITIEWELFEKDSKDDFVNIKVLHTTLERNPYTNLQHWTVLEITNLREVRTENEISELEKKLKRLINPMQTDKNDIFEIYLNNKKVENFIFEKLWFKTTQITISISNDWEFITTDLLDRWEQIYKIKERNPRNNTLNNINVVLFYMSPPIKRYFVKEVWVPSIEFWSIFLYKNGFRVYPFGEPNEDAFWLDKRKTQWYSRFLWTRDLFWRIEINNSNNDFKESTSRDWWLIKTKAYSDLQDFLINFAIKRFEAYVVEALEWVYRKDRNIEFSPENKQYEIKKMIEKLTWSRDFIETEFSYEILEKIEEKNKKGIQWATDLLKIEAKKSWNVEIMNAVKKIEKNQEFQGVEIKRKDKIIEISNEQISALRKFSMENFENLKSYHHQILISSKIIDNYILCCFNKLRKSADEKLEDYLQKIKKENDKIKTIARFSTGSWMNSWATKTVKSLNSFIVQYLKNDYIPVASDWLNIQIIDNIKDDFLLSFRSFDISMVFDNLLDNAKKAKAKQCTIELNWDANLIEILIKDDWKWIDKKFIDNTEKIFDLKISSTDWAGIWLFHVKQIVNDLNWNITVSENLDKKWVTFTLIFTKNAN